MSPRCSFELISNDQLWLRASCPDLPPRPERLRLQGLGMGAIPVYVRAESRVALLGSMASLPGAGRSVAQRSNHAGSTAN